MLMSRSDYIRKLHETWSLSQPGGVDYERLRRKSGFAAAEELRLRANQTLAADLDRANREFEQAMRSRRRDVVESSRRCSKCGSLIPRHH